MERTIKRVQIPLPEQPKLIRVAAYARVSTGKDAMLHSLSAQVCYYSDYIQSHPGWVYAGVYSDEAITGTKESRAGFQQMLEDCRTGKIDLVITKSISRFARNTVTLLESVRELKALGIDVLFEEQNIHTLSGEGELMLTILASYAEEESRSNSENMKWRIRKGYENGELLNWRRMYGFRITKDSIEINEPEAQIIREIFDRVIAGESLGAIAADLNKRNITTLHGRPWRSFAIGDLIRNEKVAGNALSQKKYVNNYRDKKLCVNRGELPMYYAEATHPAIVDPETFERANAVLDAHPMHAVGIQPKPRNALSGKIHCGCCGSTYKRVTAKKRCGYHCRSYQTQGKKACPESKFIPEETLLAEIAAVLRLTAYDEVIFDREIKRIDVPLPNHLVFVFHDGHLEERIWKDRSRSESWTPEMRENARENGKMKGKVKK